VWSVFEKVTHSNARYQALDNLTFHVYSVKMPVGFGKVLTSKGRPNLDVASENEHCGSRGHGELSSDPDYQSYRKGWKTLPEVRELLQARASISAEEKVFPSYKPFSAIYLSLELGCIWVYGTRASRLMGK